MVATTYRVKWSFDGRFADAKAGDNQLTRYIRVAFAIWAERGWRAKSGKVHYAMHMGSRRDGESPMFHCGKNTARFKGRSTYVKIDGKGLPTVRITCLQCLHYIMGDLARAGKLPGCPKQ